MSGYWHAAQHTGSWQFWLLMAAVSVVSVLLLLAVVTWNRRRLSRKHPQPAPAGLPWDEWLAAGCPVPPRGARTLACAHMSITGTESASCSICGPLAPAGTP